MLNKKFIALLVIALISLIIVGGILLLINSIRSSPANNTQNAPKNNAEVALEDEEVYSTESAGLANPASVKCEEVGGKLTIEKRGDGSEYGICVFENGRECEEWALYKDLCPAEGVEVNNSATGAEKYCQQAGGIVNEESELCELPDGNSCNIEKYYNGGCE